MLSIVIPVLNEEESIPYLVDSLERVLEGEYEMIFVDDGSTDGTFSTLKRCRERNERIKIIRFRRNFGKAAALSAGFKHARGNIVITMDGDLQDDPAEIPNFIKKLEEGYDLVVGWKFDRKDPLSKTIPSKIFNKLTAIATGLKIHDFNCGFKGYRKEVLGDIRVYGELHRYIPALAYWKGYRVGEIRVKHHPRKYGRTKYGASRLIKGFLDLITITFLLQYTKTPLHLFGIVGLVSTFVSFVLGLYFLYIKYALGMAIGNRPLLLLVLLLAMLGIQLISIGLLGEMIVSATRLPEDDYSIREIVE
ncbi:MAG: glycosyltransferase family 2 protein [Candidatus Syntropharchaeia archaeon]